MRKKSSEALRDLEVGERMQEWPSEPPPQEPPVAVPSRKSPEALFAPSVWRESGYLVLVVSIDEDDEVFYVSTFNGAKRASVEQFSNRNYTYLPEVNPHHLALNMLARLRTGTFELRVRDERTLIDMISKDELMKLSERQLAAQYATVMGAGPARIKPERRETAINEMIAKLEENAHSRAEDPAAAVATAKVKKEKKEKKKKEPKPVKEKKVKVPKEKKEKAPRATPKIVKGDNPFREGSMKHAAFAFFIKSGGDKEKCIKQMEEGGASPSTAKSWYGVFVRVAAGAT